MRIPVYDRVVKSFAPVFDGQEPVGYIEVDPAALAPPSLPDPLALVRALTGRHGATAVCQAVLAGVPGLALVAGRPGSDEDRVAVPPEALAP